MLHLKHYIRINEKFVYLPSIKKQCSISFLKKTNEQSPIDRNSRSTSRSYSSSSRSSYTHSLVSRSSSLSSISSNSLDRHDKDYRFETTTDKQSNGDIDERFPVHTPHDDDNDALIVNCPIQDDDLIIHDEQKNNSNEKSTKKSSYSKERTSNKSSSNEKKRRKDEPRKSPTIERPISITVKLNSEEFDLRQLLKNRRANDSSQNNQRTVQILPKDKNSDVHKTMQNRLSSRRTDKNNQSVEKKYHNNKH